MFSRCTGAGLLCLAPSGHRASAVLSLPVLLLLITAASVLPRGKLTSLFSTALLVVLLRNYLSFNSLLCNMGRKQSVEIHSTKNMTICLWWRIHQNICFDGSSSINICLGFAKVGFCKSESIQRKKQPFFFFFPQSPPLFSFLSPFSFFFHFSKQSLASQPKWIYGI